MAREKCCIEQRWHLTMALKDVKIPGSSYPREPTPCTAKLCRTKLQALKELENCIAVR